MADNRVVVITDGEVNKPEVYDNPISAFAVLGAVVWSPEFFNGNIIDLIKGEAINFEGVEYKFYTYDDFTDLED